MISAHFISLNVNLKCEIIKHSVLKDKFLQSAETKILGSFHTGPDSLHPKMDKTSFPSTLSFSYRQFNRKHIFRFDEII